MSWSDLPNLISALRLLLVIPVAFALFKGDFVQALILFTVAGLSDALDGFLAKHFHWESRLGSILDPLADKLLLVVSFAILAWLELLPVWLLWLVLARDMMIVTGGLLYHYLVGRFDLLPLWSSKINTLLQISLVVLVLLQHTWFPLLDKVVTVGVWLVVISVVSSGSEYVRVWGLKAWQQMKKQ